jgi:hypothetical protein
VVLSMLGGQYIVCATNDDDATMAYDRPEVVVIVAVCVVAAGASLVNAVGCNVFWWAV